MVGWYYRGMIVNDETLVAAAEVAESRMDRWPVPQVMETLANAAADPLDCGWRSPPRRSGTCGERDMLELTRQGFLYAVLTGLRQDQLIGRLYRLVSDVFTVDAMSAQQVRNYIAMWLNRPHRIIIP